MSASRQANLCFTSEGAPTDTIVTHAKNESALMNTDDTKDLVRRYVDEVWNQANLTALDALTLPAFVYRLGGQPARDRAALAEFIRSTHAAFPDWRVEIVNLIAEGNRAMARWFGEGTHAGPFRGIPPTGRRIVVTGINVYEVSEGRSQRSGSRWTPWACCSNLACFLPPSDALRQCGEDPHTSPFSLRSDLPK